MKFFFGIRNTNNSGKMETEFGCTQEINFKHFHIFTRLNVRFQSYEVILHASLLRNGMINDTIVVMIVFSSICVTPQCRSIISANLFTNSEQIFEGFNMKHQQIGVFQ